MSQEQLRGEKLDARTDLFSFGLVLYEMASGQRAFTGETAAILRAAILRSTPVPVRELNSTLPPKLEGVIDKALQKGRELRYRSASEMETDLLKLSLVGHDLRREGEWPRHRKLVASVALALTVAGGGLFYRQSHRSRTHSASNQAKVTRLTHWHKSISSATLSRDGRTLAFTSSAGGYDQVFAVLAAGGEPAQVTFDEGDKYVDNFSPEGTEIKITASDLCAQRFNDADGAFNVNQSARQVT